MNKKASTIFVLSTLFFLFLYPFFPNYPIHFLVPWIVYLSIFSTFSRLLWASFIVGIIMDIMASTFWGLNAGAYSATTFLLFWNKRLLEYKHTSFLSLVITYSLLCELLRSLFYIHLGYNLFFVRHIFFILPCTMLVYTSSIIVIPLLLWQKMVKGAMILRKRFR